MKNIKSKWNHSKIFSKQKKSKKFGNSRKKADTVNSLALLGVHVRLSEKEAKTEVLGFSKTPLMFHAVLN